jgi:hypothetical protein
MNLVTFLIAFAAAINGLLAGLNVDGYRAREVTSAQAYWCAGLCHLCSWQRSGEWASFRHLAPWTRAFCCRNKHTACVQKERETYA